MAIMLDVRWAFLAACRVEPIPRDASPDFYRYLRSTLAT